MFFKQLNLHPGLIKSIDQAGYKQPTQIQRKAIPLAMAGDDLMASAQTGTGKTAAYLLPMIQNLIDTKKRHSSGPGL